MQAGGRDGHGLTPPEAAAAHEAVELNRARDRPQHHRWLRAEKDDWTNPGRGYIGRTEAGRVLDDNRAGLTQGYVRWRRAQGQRAYRRHTRRPAGLWDGDPNP